LRQDLHFLGSVQVLQLLVRHLRRMW
jgi:hypothetical protein